MKVKLEMSPEADISVEFDSENHPISITFEPLFASRNAHATLLYGVVISDTEKVLDRFSLVVSGAHGRLSKKNRSGGVKALADLPENEQAAAGQPALPVPGDEDSGDDES